MLEHQSSDDSDSCIALFILVITEVLQEHGVSFLRGLLELFSKEDREHDFAFARAAGYP